MQFETVQISAPKPPVTDPTCHLAVSTGEAPSPLEWVSDRNFPPARVIKCAAWVRDIGDLILPLNLVAQEGFKNECA